jgi:hypothetical protein
MHLLLMMIQQLRWLGLQRWLRGWWRLLLLWVKWRLLGCRGVADDGGVLTSRRLLVLVLPQ